MVKADGTVMLWSDGGGAKVKPLNWMSPPTVVEEDTGTIVVRKRAGTGGERLEIRLHEVLSDIEHEMGEAAGLEKDGVERDLQEALGPPRRGRPRAAPRAARVAHRHRPRRPHVPGRR